MRSNDVFKFLVLITLTALGIPFISEELIARAGGGGGGSHGGGSHSGGSGTVVADHLDGDIPPAPIVDPAIPIFLHSLRLLFSL